MASDPTQTKVQTEEVRTLRAQAAEDDAEAQYQVGLSYATGRRVPDDYVQAVAWFRKAAEQGHPKAQFSLGVAYAFGQGVPQDDVQAHMWTTLAASGASAGDTYADDRDRIAQRMTPEQLAEAQRRVQVWVKS